MTRDDDPVLRVIAGTGAAPTEVEAGAAAVADPARVLRVATTVRGVLDELRGTEPAAPVRDRLAALHDRTVEQLHELVDDGLVAELDELALADTADVSAAELRVVLAEMVGWLEGLFHGISAALVDGEEPGEPQTRAGHYL